ncbi:MAG: hypothetical protein AAF226_13400 [Verrucomicrobiota bacterium]
MKAKLSSLFFSLVAATTLLSNAGENITVNGTSYRNAEVAEVSSSGPIYRVNDGALITAPWGQLSAQQENTLRTKHRTALMNTILGAKHVKGTVFQVNQDGVIVQVTIEKDGERRGTEGFYQGAEIIKSGLVIVSDLPNDVPRGTGVEIEFFAYQLKEYEYDMAISKTNIPYVTTAKPMWAREREWTNNKGQKLVASLIAVRDGKGLFQKSDGQRFPPIDLKTLDPESQKFAAEFAEKVKGYPIP